VSSLFRESSRGSDRLQNVAKLQLEVGRTVRHSRGVRHKLAAMPFLAILAAPLIACFATGIVAAACRPAPQPETDWPDNVISLDRARRVRRASVSQTGVPITA
jgi:hypothetical protein